MKVDLHTIVWNEEEMLPFFFRHYDSLVEGYVVYDDGSTDRTLEMLAAHRVEVRPFVRTDPGSYVLSAQSLHDTVWKESRGRADWVIIAAVDEHLYHRVGLGRYLRIAGRRGITAVPALAFQMVTGVFPSSQENVSRTRRYGVPLDKYNKLSVLNPNAIDETRYEVGRHQAAPEGRVQYPKQDHLLLFHYKFLGIDYLLRRYELLSSGLGAGDKERKFGFQYDLPHSELGAEFGRLRRNAVDVTSVVARQLMRKKWWRSQGAPIDAACAAQTKAEMAAETARAEVDALRAAQAKAEMAAETARAEVDALRAAQAKAEMAAETARAEVDALRAVQAKAKMAAETARAEVDALRAAQAKAEMAAETARAEVDALRASTSWRITAPLRNVARRLRR
jgi:glycosyltransferase involved in cell wall biosynthesis